MSVEHWRLDGLVDDVVVLGRRGLPLEQYFAELSARLRRVIDSDAACWHPLDPGTRLMTGATATELVDSGVFTPETVAAAGEAVVASEYFVDDVNTFAGLASRRVPVGILSEVTDGHPERSTRWSDVMAPAGIPLEMRAAFVSRGRCWGAVHIARREDRHDFTPGDAAALARLSGPIADGIRTSLRFDAARHEHESTAPGLVVLNADNDVELITPPAHELLAALRTPAAAGHDRTPAALLALAQFVRAGPGPATREPDVVAVPTAAGWVTLHASLPEGRADGRVAIVLERTTSSEATGLRLEAHGVTAREREIATLIAQGLSNPQIAEQLVLSPYTVQDHIKSLFEKTDVSSRQELVARVFLADYMPGLAQGAPLSSSGAFSRPPQ